MKDFSYITASHPAYIENLYQDYLKNPAGVDPELKSFFEGFDFAISATQSARSQNGSANGKAAETEKSEPTAQVPTTGLEKEFAVFRLIEAYRNKGHLVAKTNPIRPRKDRHANLDLGHFGLSEADLDQTFQAGSRIGSPATLREILARLDGIYTSSVGVEYSGINDPERLKWLRDAIEVRMERTVPIAQKRRIMEKLNQGVIFEKFLHTKYIGQKRFSLEGGESLIPALDAIINKALSLDVKEIVIGMAHRGRLNVLANTLGKTYEQIFSEFEGVIPADKTMGSGDVKYHLGFSSDHRGENGGTINLQLCPNPSHLEVVDPVVLGFARAKANVLYNAQYDRILPILIHGDSALAGQGIIYEIAQMSGLDGYAVGGTIHLVINNQIGFTTDFEDARTSDYCTSIASVTHSPVLHINGDDVEAVVKAVEIAAEYRQQFNDDIYIDILCYRRHGHNEGDEPKFTQPKLYSIIEKHPNPREVYMAYLSKTGDTEVQALASEMEKKFWADMQERLDEIRQKPQPYTYQKPEKWWQELRKANAEDFISSPDTSIPEDRCRQLIGSLMKWPEDFHPLKKVEKLLQDKSKLFQTEEKIDWASGELLAYASLLTDGKDVRLSGEDVKRGTFSHRHAILMDENTNQEYNRLSRLSDKQGRFRVFNSLLSEYGVLGFEYGYSMASPNSLVLWEAQYGDFANGAQMVIDQYISSAEQKWNTMNGVVLLLPHGYEGGGPDHSSARLERFLQMSAELNMVVTNITTAANFFHALRRQLTWPFRKPLINMSPKANLRHPGSYSHISEFTAGGFREVIDDPTTPDAGGIKKVLLCSGKLYFDLAERKQKETRRDIAIVRLEQLYPLPVKQLESIYQKYRSAVWFWVQEEPLNMGAASFLQMNLKTLNYGVISRNPSASTATGFAKAHNAEQTEIIETAFTI